MFTKIGKRFIIYKKNNKILIKRGGGTGPMKPGNLQG